MACFVDLEMLIIAMSKRGISKRNFERDNQSEGKERIGKRILNGHKTKISIEFHSYSTCC